MDHAARQEAKSKLEGTAQALIAQLHGLSGEPTTMLDLERRVARANLMLRTADTINAVLEGCQRIERLP